MAWVYAHGWVGCAREEFHNEAPVVWVVDQQIQWDCQGAHETSRIPLYKYQVVIYVVWS
jgi:hypothetical protein